MELVNLKLFTKLTSGKRRLNLIHLASYLAQGIPIPCKKLMFTNQLANYSHMLGYLSMKNSSEASLY